MDSIYERLKEATMLELTALISILAFIHNAIIALMLFFTGRNKSEGKRPKEWRVRESKSV